MSATKVNEKLNSIPGRRKMSYSSTVLKINTDEKNLVSLLTVGWIRGLMYGDITVTEMNDGIGKLVSKYAEFDSSRDSFVFSIDSDKIGNPYIDSNGNINSQDFFNTLNEIRCFLKENINIVKGEINSDIDFVSYYNYLLSPKGMQDNKVRDDRARLLNILNIEPESGTEEINTVKEKGDSDKSEHKKPESLEKVESLESEDKPSTVNSEEPITNEEINSIKNAESADDKVNESSQDLDKDLEDWLNDEVDINISSDVDDESFDDIDITASEDDESFDVDEESIGDLLS
jgi:hypothetical protein